MRAYCNHVDMFGFPIYFAPSIAPSVNGSWAAQIKIACNGTVIYEYIGEDKKMPSENLLNFATAFQGR